MRREVEPEADDHLVTGLGEVAETSDEAAADACGARPIAAHRLAPASRAENHADLARRALRAVLGRLSVAAPAVLWPWIVMAILAGGMIVLAVAGALAAAPPTRRRRPIRNKS